jgi:hypothetical protein
MSRRTLSVPHQANIVVQKNFVFLKESLNRCLRS